MCSTTLSMPTMCLAWMNIVGPVCLIMPESCLITCDKSQTSLSHCHSSYPVHMCKVPVWFHPRVPTGERGSNATNIIILQEVVTQVLLRFIE